MELEKIAAALIQTIMEVGDSGVPSGVAYAALMGSIGLVEYQRVVQNLCTAGLIQKQGHLLLPGQKLRQAKGGL